MKMEEERTLTTEEAAGFLKKYKEETGRTQEACVRPVSFV